MKMHANEFSINISLVHRLIASQFPEHSQLPIIPVLPAGTDNAIYRIGDSLVARLPRLAAKERHIEKEYTWLPQLAPYLPLPVPTPVALGDPTNEYPFVWAIYEWLEGVPVSGGALDDQSAAIKLADFIGALQKIDTAGAPQPVSDFDRGQPLAKRDIHTREAIAALGDRYDIRSLNKEWEVALHSAPWHKDPVWIHGDLDGRNMLVRGGRLSAVIDFGSLNVGDPAYDIMVAWKVFSEKNRTLFKEKLKIDDATWMRSRGLALSQAVMILSYYTDKTNKVLVREAQNWMKELGF